MPVAGDAVADPDRSAAETGRLLAGASASKPLCVLLVTTLRWPLSARLALAFNELGCQVQAWCPSDHPLSKTAVVDRLHRAPAALGRLRSLHRAIAASNADLLLPCDDAATAALARLYRRLRDQAEHQPVRQLIARSLGTPSSALLATDRGALLTLAATKGARVPQQATLTSESSLQSWGQRVGYPAVLKVDGSWGGLGVVVVNSGAEARAAFRELSVPRFTPALRHWLLRRDVSFLLDWIRRAQRQITIQQFIAGVPANRAVACHRGDILAGISVMAEQTAGATGPATVVRIIDHAGMSDCAQRVVGGLGLSGLCGLDFVIDAATGLDYLIELNPRATPICHLPLSDGSDLPAALCSWLTDREVALRSGTIGNARIALFPGECRRDPHSLYLSTAHHDVPWPAPALVRDGLDLPWDQRGVLARLRAWMKPLLTQQRTSADTR
ncbi:MAG TPA: ATP-grasp domain-containing protein [Arenimonas sp.]|nr:ATP-grasp domain-containing protein [Arenimonas sp.]